jgi:hypothetical protein
VVPVDRQRAGSRRLLGSIRDRATVVTSVTLLLIAAVAWVDVLRSSLGAPDLLITAVVAAEKLLPGGEWIARVTGGALVLLGMAVALRPDLVTALRGGQAM